MLITLACSPLSRVTTHLYSGGWDGIFRAYDVHSYTPYSSVALGHPINCIKVDPSGSGDIYVGGNGGFLAKLNHTN
mgnify:CR=1 FL=1